MRTDIAVELWTVVEEKRLKEQIIINNNHQHVLKKHEGET